MVIKKASKRPSMGLHNQWHFFAENNNPSISCDSNFKVQFLSNIAVGFKNLEAYPSIMIMCLVAHCSLYSSTVQCTLM